MHKDFAEWYRLVSIEPQDEVLKKRWPGVKEWCEATEDEVDSMLDVVRLFLGRSPSHPEVRQRFADVFRGHDAAFPQRNNELELQVLAGAAAANCFTKSGVDDARGITVALAVAAGSFAPPKATKLAEISALARRRLIDLAWQRRRRTSRSIEDLNADESIPKALEVFKEGPFGDWNQVRAAVTAVFQDLRANIEKLQNAIVDMDQDLTRADEECNMLWWLEGGCSRDLKGPWAALPKESVPAIASKELADLTEVLPGPNVAQTLLHSVVSRVGLERVSISDAVNKVPVDWLKASLDSRRMSRISDLTPVWLALKQRSEANDDRAWQPFFEKRVGADPLRAIGASEMAEQLYLESLLLKALDVED